MSTTFRKTNHRRRVASRRGMALLLVLGSLVLLTALILALLIGAQSNLKSSKLYANGSSVKTLADSTVNLVMAQIQQATSNGTTVAWASQPGMIRTYDNTGNVQNNYRLFSWDTLATGKQSYTPDTIPTTWSQNPALFVDLNKPIADSGGALHYPILDGNPSDLAAYTTPSGSSALTYNNPVSGFWVLKNAPLSTSATAQPNDIPMPVKWLYVLQDGTVVAPATTSTGTTATISAATTGNPIVGRIAFWTDDDTSKININTASEGTYWGTPLVDNSSDQNLAVNQPAQNEFQRYPGHPAMTSLSTVFSKLTPEQIYTIIPRVVGGNSSSLEGSQTATNILTPDTDRLFDSVDELLFQPQLGTGTPALRQANAPSINNTSLDQLQFFLTAHSRAPDVTLFNQPRISMWPVSATDDAAHRSAYDQLAAFCSKIGGNIFYFERQDPNSPTTDLPATATTTGVGRNRALVEYLRNLLGQNIPGFGGNFRGKYGADTDQILTEMFDYIRAINLQDQTVNVSYTGTAGNAGAGQVVPIVDQATNTRGFGRFHTISGGIIQFIGVAVNTPTTSYIPPGIMFVQAIFYPTFFDPSAGYSTTNAVFGVGVSGLDQLQWQSWANASATPASTTIGFAKEPSASTTPLVWVDMNHSPIANDRLWGASMGFNEIAGGLEWSNEYYPFIGQGSTGAGSGGGAFMLDPSITPNSTFQFTGGTVTVYLFAPNGTLLQSVDLAFPSGTFPVPSLAPSNVGGYNFQTLLNNNKARLAAINDGTQANWIAPQDVVRSIVPANGDMRMIVPRQVIKATDANYSTFFTTHSQYFNSANSFAHNQRNSMNMPFYGATGGRLLPLNYSGNTYPVTYPQNNVNLGGEWYITSDSSVVPDTFTNGVALGQTTGNTGSQPLGDWDNGVAAIEDGPYINKADEGNDASSQDTAASGSYPYYGYKPTPPQPTIFSPNRMVPSPGIMGSLPSGVLANKPWQTLLFCANPPAGNSHPGFGTPLNGATTGPDAWPPYKLPPDHLLMDLFNMPVVEPYAISEPLSTAGRINMNYQIVPFTYINRDTGLQAVLKSEQVIAFPNTAASWYKQGSFSPNAAGVRQSIDADQTMIGFDRRFNPQNYGLSNSPDIFRSPSEICDIYLVPQGQTYSGTSSWWSNYQLTGDNSRERPYATIYPRLTTKSNTFTVHVYVQTLKKITGSTPTAWDESHDIVTGEYRGYTTIERYVDPNDPSLSPIDFALPANAGTALDNWYKFRVVSTKQFAQ